MSDTYTISAQEKALLDAATETCLHFGWGRGKVFTYGSYRARAQAEGALLDLIATNKGVDAVSIAEAKTALVAKAALADEEALRPSLLYQPFTEWDRSLMGKIAAIDAVVDARPISEAELGSRNEATKDEKKERRFRVEELLLVQLIAVQVVFVMLKVTGMATASWWAVTSLTWFPIAAYLVIAALAVVVIVIGNAIDGWKAKNKTWQDSAVHCRSPCGRGG